MSEWIIAGVVAFWVACGVIAYGGTIAYFQNQYWDVRDGRRDRGLALFMFLCGPMGLLIVALSAGRFRYGLQWRGSDSEYATQEKEREAVRMAEFRERRRQGIR